MEIRKYAAGDLICSEGSDSDEIFIVRSGRVRVFKTINSEKVELGFISQNDLFGEMSMFLKSKRTASIEASEASEIIVLDKKSVFEQIKKDPDFALQMITRLSLRLRQAHQVIAKLEGENKSLKILYGGK